MYNQAKTDSQSDHDFPLEFVPTFDRQRSVQKPTTASRGIRFRTKSVHIGTAPSVAPNLAEEKVKQSWRRLTAFPRSTLLRLSLSYLDSYLEMG